MSYANVVLQDSPLAFYHLDEVSSGNSSNYTNLKSKYATYQDIKDNAASYSVLSGLPIYDSSGNLNDGYAIGASAKILMPIVSGGVRGTEILPTTTISFNTNGIATKHYADNSFSIECWVRLPDVSSSKINIVADSINGIGLFYQNGDVLLSNGSSTVRYKIPNTRACYLVGIISNKALSLYIDGIFINSIAVQDAFKFTNESSEFNVGPAPIGDTFIIDDVAFYRYELNKSQIIKHYNEGIKEVPVSQIVSSDLGYLFTLNSASIRPVFSYAYPKDKSWSQLIGNNDLLSVDKGHVSFKQTIDKIAGSFTFIDEIIVPSSLDVVSSQINYDDDIDNILVEASMDGITWVRCLNNNPIPFFNKNDGIPGNILKLKVTMSSSDTSKDLPILKNIYIDFYSNKDFYSDNSSYKIYSNYDYGISRYNSRTLAYDEYNGLSPYNGHAIKCNIDKPIRTIEMIYTTDGLGNVLFSSGNSQYSWNNSGTISKTGISKIYINNIDRTSVTNIFDVLSPETPHHIVLILSSNAVSNITFNANQNDTSYGTNNLYNNIALYESALTQSQVDTHFLLYTNRLSNTIIDQSITLSESVDNLTGSQYNSAPYYFNELNWLSSSI